MLERLAALALCAVVTAPAAVAAQPDAATGIDPIDRTMTQCLNDPEHASTAGQDECVVDAGRAWDARLNASYRALQASLPAADRPALLRAQRAWLARRDADLKLIGAVYATTRGTIYAPMNANDVMELTRQRALSLQRFEADRAAHGFSLATRLPPATDDRPERVDAVPRRGARFERVALRGARRSRRKGPLRGAGRAAVPAGYRRRDGRDRTPPAACIARSDARVVAEMARVHRRPAAADRRALRASGCFRRAAAGFDRDAR